MNWHLTLGPRQLRSADDIIRAFFGLLFVWWQTLPVAQLDSLDLKASSIIESINYLAWAIWNGNSAIMPSWLDITYSYLRYSFEHNWFTQITLMIWHSTNRTNCDRAPCNKLMILKKTQRIAIRLFSNIAEQELDTELHHNYVINEHYIYWKQRASDD